LEAAIQAEFAEQLAEDAELVRGDNGIFDVYCDDVLLFSKHAEGRFPTDEEILKALRSL